MEARKDLARLFGSTVVGESEERSHEGWPTGFSPIGGTKSRPSCSNEATPGTLSAASLRSPSRLRSGLSCLGLATPRQSAMTSSRAISGSDAGRESARRASDCSWCSYGNGVSSRSETLNRTCQGTWPSSRNTPSSCETSAGRAPVPPSSIGTTSSRS